MGNGQLVTIRKMVDKPFATICSPLHSGEGLGVRGIERQAFCERSIIHGGGRAHHNLEAWKISRELVRNVYVLTKTFPKEEIFGLTAQIRRSAVSVASNIAEGAARAGNREFSQFLNVARGSLSELETQLLIAADVGYIKESDPVFDVLDHASRLITGLHK